MNQKILFTVMVAILALAVTAVTAVNYSPAHAAQPRHCSHSSGSCFSSEVQCEKRSPGKSGAAQC